MENELQKSFYKNLEILSIIGSIAALIMKALQFQFVAPMLIVFVGTLAIVYAIIGNEILKNKKSDTENKPTLIFSGVTLSIGLIGISFKLMYWPNAMNIIRIANVVIPISICICLWLKMNTNDSVKGNYNKLLMRAFIIYPVVLILYFTPMSTLIAFQDRGDSEMIRLKTQSYEHPENEDYRRQLNHYWHLKNLNDSIK